jgi:glycosyltransferase involved in cell wall biosynthesis
VFSRAPFIITFEDWMPRTPPDHRIAWLERMLTNVIAGDRCVALVAMSRFAKDQMMLQQRQSPHYGRLMEKTVVIHPGVPFRPWRPKKLSRTLRLLFVGADFMRKGLPVLISAHEKLESLDIPVQTTVVSSLRWHRGDYVGPNSKRLVEDQKRRLRNSTITVFDRQPNDVVQRMMRDHDFLILPTFHDTFGFVILEAMATGTPVIATETCAIPEIIDGNNGLLLPLPTDLIGRWDLLYQKRLPDYDYRYASACIHLTRALVDHLSSVWQERDRYEMMSAAALVTIANQFAQNIARERLEALYERATRK